MGIEQIRMNQTKALPPVPQFNWSQMESSGGKFCGSFIASAKIRKRGWRRIDVEKREENFQPKTRVPKNRNPGHPASSHRTNVGGGVSGKHDGSELE